VASSGEMRGFTVGACQPSRLQPTPRIWHNQHFMSIRGNMQAKLPRSVTPPASGVQSTVYISQIEPSLRRIVVFEDSN